MTSSAACWTWTAEKFLSAACSQCQHAPRCVIVHTTVCVSVAIAVRTGRTSALRLAFQIRCVTPLNVLHFVVSCIVVHSLQQGPFFPAMCMKNGEMAVNFGGTPFQSLPSDFTGGPSAHACNLFLDCHNCHVKKCTQCAVRLFIPPAQMLS